MFNSIEYYLRSRQKREHQVGLRQLRSSYSASVQILSIVGWEADGGLPVQPLTEARGYATASREWNRMNEAHLWLIHCVREFKFS